MITLSVIDAAREIGVHPTTIYRLINCGDLSAPVAADGSQRINRADVDAIANARAEAATHAAAMAAWAEVHGATYRAGRRNRGGAA